jgi:hypothetical protein
MILAPRLQARVGRRFSSRRITGKVVKKIACLFVTALGCSLEPTDAFRPTRWTAFPVDEHARQVEPCCHMPCFGGASIQANGSGQINEDRVAIAEFPRRNACGSMALRIAYAGRCSNQGAVPSAPLAQGATQRAR